MTSFLRTFAEDPGALQQQMDAAVVIPTILRPSLVRAVQSVFAQTFAGRIQLLIGIDRPQGDPAILEAACAARPPNCIVQALYPGYSTSSRNGGLSPAGDGGVLRCVLTFLANSRYVAYLDDDNWWDPSHLQTMWSVLQGAVWAFALRWFVHPASGRPVAVDRWESVGPGAGVFAQQFGGFVDPSCLMVDKTGCPDVIQAWNFPLLTADPGSADRRVFHLLSRRHKGAGTGLPTVFYRMNPADILHQRRVLRLGTAYEDAGRLP
jgi:glycosyltransferase involved in cell wall biosynthesis